MAQPVVKWAGGKRQLIDELEARCPTNFDQYHEPFFGGGALFFHLEPETATINDANPRLVNLYKQVRDRPEALIEILEQFDDPGSTPDPEREFSSSGRKGQDIDEYYYQQRELFNRRPNGEDFDRLEEAALFLYLNRTCYNGLYRVNQSGEFNSSKGSYDNPNWVQRDRLRTASDALVGVEIRHGDYSYVLDAATAGDLVYFDPPYSETSNHAYTDSNFGDDDEQRGLIDVAAELSDEGVDVILSNSGDMYDQYLDAGFEVVATDADRPINNDADNREQSVGEVIATSVDKSDWRGGRQTDLESYGK